jgi:carbon monoxide dehydrogenase subunit G
VHVTREVPLAAAPAAVWRLLWDVPRIVGCVPGCVDAKELEPQRRYTARMKQKVGVIGLSAALDVEVVDAVPERRLALRAHGRDPLVGAEIVLGVALDLEPRAEGSLLRIDAEGRLLGKLGALGHATIQRKAEESVAEFAARLREAVA